MGDDKDSSLASLTAILDESLPDASTSEATEVQSRKGTKSAVKPTRKGRTSAEKHTDKQAEEKLSNTQSPPKDGEAGKVSRRTTNSHTSKVAEDMADIKQQLKDLTGSLALITLIDLKRRTLFKGDMRTEYRLLCSDQNPVENGLLFGTELGKSVKDLTEASKVTSKVAMKQKTPHASSDSFHGRSESRRPFPFLGQGRGSVGKQRGGYRNPPHRSQPQYQPRQ